MEKLLISSHVLAGALVLITGLLNFIVKKGGLAHRKLGIAYVVGMAWVFVSVVLIVTFYRFSLFLLVVGVLSFYSTYTGFRVTKRKAIGDEKWFDWMASVLSMLFGAGLVGYAVYLSATLGLAAPLTILSFIFGVFSFLNGFQDFRFFMFPRTELHKLWWLQKHISAIGGSYIAAVTAFTVQNGDRLMPGSEYQWLLWILPALLASPVIAVFTRRYAPKGRPKLAV